MIPNAPSDPDRPSPNEKPGEAMSLHARMGGRESIEKLLKYFYSDVRQHRVIGPIFSAKIHDWPTHLSKIADFWEQITGGPARFKGDLPIKHLQLGLAPEHFKAWLSLWESNCRIYLASDVAEEMIGLARAIGQRLQSSYSENDLVLRAAVKTK